MFNFRIIAANTHLESINLARINYSKLRYKNSPLTKRLEKILKDRKRLVSNNKTRSFSLFQIELIIDEILSNKQMLTRNQIRKLKQTRKDMYNVDSRETIENNSSIKHLNVIHQYVKKNNLDEIFHLGDLLNDDLYYAITESDLFNPDINTEDEIEENKEIFIKKVISLMQSINYIDEKIGQDCNFRFIIGNHEYRIQESLNLLAEHFNDNQVYLDLINNAIKEYSRFIEKHVVSRTYQRGQYGIIDESGYFISENALCCHELFSEDILWSLWNFKNVVKKQYFEDYLTAEQIKRLFDLAIDKNGIVKKDLPPLPEWGIDIPEKEYLEDIYFQFEKTNKYFNYISNKLDITYEQTVALMLFIKNNIKKSDVNAEIPMLIKLYMDAFEKQKQGSDIRNLSISIKYNGESILVGNLIHKNILSSLEGINNKNITLFFGHHHRAAKILQLRFNGNKILFYSAGSSGARYYTKSGLIEIRNGVPELIDGLW